MVSRESFRKAQLKEQRWLDQHPNISRKELIKHRISNVSGFVKESLEMDIRLATLPSVLVPMPKSRVNEFQRHIDKINKKFAKKR